MTTVVVTRKDGIACIAADTRAAYGDTREGADLICNSDKIVRAGDAWLAPTGPASAQLVLRHDLRRLERAPRLDSIDSLFGFLTEFQKSLRDEYLVHGKEDQSDDFESMRMEIAVVSPGGIFGCYPQRSVQEYKRFYAFGSGAAFALGAMQVAEPHVRSAEELARIGVEAATAFDLHSGLPLTLRTVELRGVAHLAVPNGHSSVHGQNGTNGTNGANGAHEPPRSIPTRL
jgi:ATP-dependent HslUV protease subunit HslV